MPNNPTTRTSLDDLAALNAELAALVRAQIPLEPELRRLARQLPRGAGALANRLAGRMEAGGSLADAMDAEGRNLPEVYRAVVMAGLESGDPATALERIAESSRRLASLRQTTGIAMLVPMAVVIVASLCLAVVMMTVFSRIAWIAPKRFSGIEQWANEPLLLWTLVALVPALAICIPLLWWWRTRGTRSMTASRWWLLGWIPGARDLHRLTASGTLAEVLRMTMATGLPLQRGLRLAAGAAGHPGYRRAAMSLANQVERGDDWQGTAGDASPVLKKLPPLVQIALQLSGSRAMMTAALDRAARSYQSRADLLHGSLSEFVPALLTVGVAGTVTAAFCVGLMWSYAQMLFTLADGMWQ